MLKSSVADPFDFNTDTDPFPWITDPDPTPNPAYNLKNTNSSYTFQKYNDKKNICFAIYARSVVILVFFFNELSVILDEYLLPQDPHPNPGGRNETDSYVSGSVTLLKSISFSFCISPWSNAGAKETTDISCVSIIWR